MGLGGGASDGLGVEVEVGVGAAAAVGATVAAGVAVGPPADVEAGGNSSPQAANVTDATRQTPTMAHLMLPAVSNRSSSSVVMPAIPIINLPATN